MNKLLTYVLLVASFSALFSGCSDKNSNEACVHGVTMNLDKGNYDAVVASGCADGMQKGAAYLGKAGYDVGKVAIRISEANSTTSGSSGNFSVMSTLTGTVDDVTITNLGKSKTEYLTVPPTSDSYKDAQFFAGFVDTVKSLSLIKSLVDVFGNGTLNDKCDMNGNSKPDSLDTTGCALLIGAGKLASQCTPSGTMALITDSPNLTLKSTVSDTTLPGAYRGMIIESSGTGSNVSTCPKPNRYKYLLVSAGTTTFYSLATTVSGTSNCEDATGEKWPCPLIADNANGKPGPIDLVAAFDSSLTSAGTYMNISSGATTSSGLSTGATTTAGDMAQLITKTKATACPSGTCTAADIAAYLQK